MSLLGYPLPRHRDAALARVGAIVNEPRFHCHLAGRQNLRLLAAAREPAARDRIGPALERVGLAHRADDRVSEYSMGMSPAAGDRRLPAGRPPAARLDEPMNGLDPAGIAEMRHMIRSLVAEGRTVVLSSHLLDEVERTCDAVAIVDRGSIIQQGPISELLAGAPVALQVECSDPGRSRALLAGTTLGARVETVPSALGLEITLPAGTGRDVIAEINRVLVNGGNLDLPAPAGPTSLESWLLQVTSRVGGSGMTTLPAHSAPAPGQAPAGGRRSPTRPPAIPVPPPA